MHDLTSYSVPDLLRLYASVMDQLRERAVLRSSNGPAGDYAELLFSRAFDWVLKANSSSGHDANDAEGLRYQVKCRRITARNPSRQLSAIRNLDARPFDFIAAVLLDEAFKVTRAAIIPYDVVKQHATFTKHTNSSRFILRDSVWKIEGVRDVTNALREAEGKIE
jgi:hypothetical protein